MKRLSTLALILVITMTTGIYTANAGSPGHDGTSRFNVEHGDDPITPSVTKAQADYTTFLADYDALAAVIVGVSGDTYSATTHQFTEGGSTGLTSAQLHTAMTSLNAAITAFLAGNVALAAGSLAQTNSVLVAYDQALSTNQMKAALRGVVTRLGN